MQSRAMKKHALWIAGREVTTPRMSPVTDPFDQSLISEVAQAEPSHMEEALKAADRIQKDVARIPTHQRVAVLRHTAHALRLEKESLAGLITRESGKPIRFSRGEVDRAATTFDLAAAACLGPSGEVLPTDISPAGDGRLGLVSRFPRGPVAAISPFNFPLNLVAHKVAPAIAAGCPVVLKPAPQTPLTSYRLLKIILEIGWPEAALQVVPCPSKVAQMLVTDPRTKVVSFTGSDAVGWHLKGLAPQKQFLLELGGNAPCMVDEGVDLECILPRITMGAWAYGGQVCIKVQRIYVHRSLQKEFLARFVEQTEALSVGDPKLEDTVVGPLIDESHRDRVMSWIREAEQAQATVRTGARSEGSIVWPTILTDTPRDARVVREEIFGPVTVVEPYDHFDDALNRCNQGRYGLQAGVFTPSIARALQAHRTLEFGGVLINDVPTFRSDNFPYGGVKQSGFGREGVHYAIEEMTEPRLLIMGPEDLQA